MPKINSSGVRGPIFSFIVRIIIFSVLSVILFSAVFSYIVYKFDLDNNYVSYFSVAITVFSSIIISFYSVKPFKNNGFAVGIISVIPLCIYSLINTIVFDNSAVFFIIKLAAAIIAGGIIGNYSVKHKKKFKVK